MTKGEFSKEISRIVKKYPCRTQIIGSDREFILEACKKCSRYATLASEENVILKPGYHRIANGRKVKMLFLHRSGSGFSVPVSKSVLVNTVYPVKKRATSASPEERNRSKVRAAMRNMVAYQLSDYRKSLIYPLTCWRSGARIIKGMKTDVDHIGDPFVKIADDFLARQGLTYADVVLAGPVNNKRFKDEYLSSLWIEFHKERATLALVLASENRSAGCGDYSSPEELLGSFEKEGAISLDF